MGGNSASLRQNVAGIPAADQTHIKIGSYAIIDNVYLGNNGANMIRTNEPVGGHNEGVLRTFTRTDIASDGTPFSSGEVNRSLREHSKRRPRGLHTLFHHVRFYRLRW